MPPSNIVEQPDLRDRTHVFRDRRHAGEVVARLLSGSPEGPERSAVLFAIPAGGVPVAAAAADVLALPLETAVVSKITLPWNTEAGYGAVAFDGTVKLNEPLVARLGLSAETVAAGVAATRKKVESRAARFRRDRPMPDPADGTAVLVDDGLASGFTMRTAVAAMKNAGAARIVVAVPTGHDHSVAAIAAEVDRIFCPNIRTGHSFAVAEAYDQWYDVPESEVEALLAGRGP